jgi:acetate kinase
MNVLVLNSGSSSLKFQLIATDPDRIARDTDERLVQGEMEGIGGETTCAIRKKDGPRESLNASMKDLEAALEFVIGWIASEESGLQEVRGPADIHAVGHRVVHGGEHFSESVVVSDEVLKGIEQCSELAPLHNPDNLKGILAVRRLLGERVPQVAVFDTAFHQSLPECAYVYAIPYELYQRHRIRRYGFHGTSHRYVMHRYQLLGKLMPEKTHVITLHLRNGCSVAAIRGGQPMDTSMGMTPLEGLVMGTRSGDIDPAIVTIIGEKEGLSAHEVDSLLNARSGLLGVSGTTNDMRGLQAEAQDEGNKRAQLAIDIFCYRARKYIGAYLAGMGGADAVVFTGGIGENSPEIRGQICAGMEWAGIALDAERNRKIVGKEGLISSDSSKLAVYAIPTDEELLIARDTVRCILGEAHPS